MNAVLTVPSHLLKVANVGTIYQSLAKCYGSLVDNSDDRTKSYKETREADEIAHSAAKILNSKVWMPMKEPSA